MRPPLEEIWASLNWVDLVLGLALLAALLIGVGMGFYRQLAIVASLVLGWVLASQFTAPLAGAEWFAPVHTHCGSDGAEFIAYAAVILATVGVGVACILIFRRHFGKPMRVFDSAVGGATGAGIAALAAGLLVLGIFRWEETWLHQPLRDSYLGSHLAEGARAAAKIFPDEYRERVEASIEGSLVERVTHFATSPRPQEQR